MKKNLLVLLFTTLTLLSVRADLIWYEGFDYPDGSIIAVSTNLAGTVTNWARHSGTANPSDAVVRNNRLEVSTSGTGGRSDDVNRQLGAPYDSTLSTIFSSFTVNFTNLPTANGAYFAHTLTNSPTAGFVCRIWALTGNPNGTSNVFSALPGTFRVGISAGSVGSPNKIFPVDLATNTDYQIVAEWDPVTLLAARIWVNPISSADSNPGYTSDSAGVPSPANIKAVYSFGFRQATGFGGFLTVSNLAVATTWEEAAAAVWSATPVAPVIVYHPKSGTNFTGSVALLSGVAAGQGLADMTYTWLKDGGIYPNPNGNTNTLSFPSAAVGDSGDYQLVATTPNGLSATSTVASLWVTNAPIPPTINTHPVDTQVYLGQTATLTVAATGPGTITYTWLTNDIPVSGTPNIDGPVLIISNVQSNNGTTGTYRCAVSNEFGGVLSSNAVVSAIPVPAVSIAYLRTLVDPVNFTATNTTALWKATGTVTTFTNLTTGNTSSYYMQDSTAGINIFATFASTFRPALGDVVTFVGTLSSFNSTLELLADTVNNPLSSYTILSNNLAGLPAPKVIPFGITNNLALTEAIEGSIVMLTNVYFTTNAIISTNANTTVLVTNGSGETFTVFFSFQDQDTAGQQVPGFAWSVIGPLTQNLGNGIAPRNQGYQITVTRFADIVTNPPPAVSVTESRAGNSTTLSWPAVPYNYSYSVLAATDVAGPYVPEPSFQATMLGINEVPANASTGTGFGTVALSPDQSTITVNMQFSGLSANASAAHIHGPAGAGTNAGVLFGFTGVPAATSGAIPEQSFAITPTQLGYLTNGLLYMNVHDSKFGGGEVRGQLLLAPSVGKTFTTANGVSTDINASGAQKFYRVTSP